MTRSTPAIAASGLLKRYGGRAAVDHLDLSVLSGQVLALLGPNGAGKSTLTEMVLGLTQPDAGSVQVYGRPPAEAIRRGDVGAMLQQGTLLPDATVRTTLRTLHGLHAHPLPFDDVVALADVGSLLRSPTGKLSGGEAQRVRFAIAIMPDPSLLLLDEPTDGMDVEVRHRFWATMRAVAAGGRTIVFTTHHLDEADAFADRVVVIDRGRVVADGSSADVKQVVGGRQVTFTGPGADYAALPGVVHADRVGDRHTLVCTDSDATLRALLADPDVHAVEVTAPRLEDAFLRLVA